MVHGKIKVSGQGNMWLERHRSKWEFMLQQNGLRSTFDGIFWGIFLDGFVQDIEIVKL